jgi:hypothetical protein
MLLGPHFIACSGTQKACPPYVILCVKDYALTRYWPWTGAAPQRACPWLRRKHKPDLPPLLPGLAWPELKTQGKTKANAIETVAGNEPVAAGRTRVPAVAVPRAAAQNALGASVWPPGIKRRLPG